MIAYAIYTIITLLCIRSHFCSFILRFSYIYILHIVISFSILSFFLSYVMNASMHSGIHIFIYSFLYSYLFISFTYSCHVFMNTSIPITFSIFSLFHAYYIWHLRYLYDMMPIHALFMYSSPSMNLFYVEIGITPIGSFKLKLWHFHAN